MTGQLKVILSTYGGGLGKQSKIDRAERALQAVGLEYDLELTEYAGHGVELARRAGLAGWPVVVAAGGDGTVNEVANGLIEAAGDGEAGILGVLPLGTGNDFADEGLKIPRHLVAAAQHLALGKTWLIDVGRVNGHYFVNNSAVGLEAVVTVAHNRLRLIKGNLRYIVAALQSLATTKPWPMRLNWPEGQDEGPTTLVSIGNNHRTGGSFYLTPQARLDDGLLDFLYGCHLSRWQLLRLLPQALKGEHLDHPQVAYHRTTELTITTDRPTPIQADGEIIDQEATKIHYQVIPAKLRVII